MPASSVRADRGPVPQTLLAIALLAAAGALAAFGPLLSGLDPLTQNVARANADPSVAHWLGNDHLGRDIFTRLAVGTRLTMVVALASTAGAILLGAVLGLVCVAAGRTFEFLAFGAFDLVRAMPSILLAMTLLVALGPGVPPVTLAIAIAFAPVFAHVARAAWARETTSGYVAAAATMGSPPLVTLARHVAPNVAGAVVTQAAIVMPRAITTESVLSFFGIGVTPGTPTWGRMIADSVKHAEAAPTAVLAPVLALALTTLAFALLGDRLRLRWDPLRKGSNA
ncbi:MAG: ABC transporter permease [Azospirillum sp.]|nr:ABC transporter permease [Azospirillum sp.]MCA3267977.1 ABC transporter permease [Azospirillum sp.]